MKYIDVPELAHLAQSLNHEGPECSVYTRMEAYSCKNIKRDKKLFKALESSYQDDVSNSPPLPSWLALDHEADPTPFGPIGEHASRKTLYLLIATLNIAFPDYEFSDVRPSHFAKEASGASVLNALSNTLVASQRGSAAAPRTYSSYPPTSADSFSSQSCVYSQGDPPVSNPLHPPAIVAGTHPTLFRLVDEVIGLSDCEVYSYAPEIDADPHANGFSDDEDDVASSGSSTDDEATFEFDDYDIDEVEPRSFPDRRPVRIPALTHRGVSGLSSLESDDDCETPVSSPGVRLKRRGALLWSSHWFFLNRKQKRILFISVWARSKGIGRSYIDDEDMYVMDMKSSNSLDEERFFGWEGGVGAGARALGLKGFGYA